MATTSVAQDPAAAANATTGLPSAPSDATDVYLSNEWVDYRIACYGPSADSRFVVIVYTFGSAAAALYIATGLYLLYRKASAGLWPYKRQRGLIVPRAAESWILYTLVYLTFRFLHTTLILTSSLPSFLVRELSDSVSLAALVVAMISFFFATLYTAATSAAASGAATAHVFFLDFSAARDVVVPVPGAAASTTGRLQSQQDEDAMSARRRRDNMPVAPSSRWSPLLMNLWHLLYMATIVAPIYVSYQAGSNADMAQFNISADAAAARWVAIRSYVWAGIFTLILVTNLFVGTKLLNLMGDGTQNEDSQTEGVFRNAKRTVRSSLFFDTLVTAIWKQVRVMLIALSISCLLTAILLGLYGAYREQEHESFYFQIFGCILWMLVPEFIIFLTYLNFIFNLHHKQISDLKRSNSMGTLSTSRLDGALRPVSRNTTASTMQYDPDLRLRNVSDLSLQPIAKLTGWSSAPNDNHTYSSGNSFVSVHDAPPLAIADSTTAVVTSKPTKIGVAPTAVSDSFASYFASWAPAPSTTATDADAPLAPAPLFPPQQQQQLQTLPQYWPPAPAASALPQFPAGASAARRASKRSAAPPPPGVLPTAAEPVATPPSTLFFNASYSAGTWGSAMPGAGVQDHGRSRGDSAAWRTPAGNL
ncbi:hypothetical protein HK405_002818 [Cladochytrium tenue]|nr:hypothetical protein HK405_002818 [Cladochytrium tenue]